MSLKIIASLVVADISFHVEGASVADVATAITQLKNGEQVVGATVTTTDKAEATKAPKPEKSAKAEKPAASSPPAAEPLKADTAASEKKVEASASAKVADTYEKTGFAEKIAAYLGNKETDAAGYAERRTSLVALLSSFNVKKGPELKPEQFADFGKKLEALITAPAAEEALG